MRDSMLQYFQAEKQEALVFLAVGAVTLVSAVMLLKGGGAWRTMAWPLGAVALIQVSVGGAVFFRTDGQVAALERTLEADPPAFRSAESARMAGVMSSFRDYEVIEVVLIAVGIGLTAVFPQRQALYAVGVGLVAQAAFMLVLDLFAAQRGRAYLDALSRLA
jgi:hypothetical protein